MGNGVCCPGDSQKLDSSDSDSESDNPESLSQTVPPKATKKEIKKIDKQKKIDDPPKQEPKKIEPKVENNKKKIDNKKDEIPEKLTDAKIKDILIEFEKFVNDKHYGNLRSLIKEYPTIDFINHQLTDHNNEKIIHVATRLTNKRFLKFILQKKADPNELSKNGENALHIATKMSEVAIIEILLDNNANIHTKNIDGKNALDIAYEINDKTIIDTLKKYDDDSDYSQSTSIDVQTTEDESMPNKPWIDNDTPSNTEPSISNTSHVKEKKLNLPVLYGELYKKRKKTNAFQKRYLCVIDKHLIWNQEKINLQPHSKLNEHQKQSFNGFLSLKSVTKVISSDKNKENRFEITGYNPKSKKKFKLRTYVWKCDKQSERDKWVKGLNLYLDSLK